MIKGSKHSEASKKKIGLGVAKRMAQRKKDPGEKIQALALIIDHLDKTAGEPAQTETKSDGEDQ